MPRKHLPYPYVETAPVSIPQIEIEVLADKRAAEWGFRDGRMLDEVCKKAGVDIEYSHNPNEIMLEVPLDTRPVIWLPKKGRKKDDRVIIATALGHWALQVEETQESNPGCGVQALYEPGKRDALEQAKAFGLAFLMPTQEFITAWEEGLSQATASRFEVPTEVVYLRARSLELQNAM